MPAISESDIRHIHNLDSLFDFLRDKLAWEIRDDLAPEDFFYDYTADELHFDKTTADKVTVRQLAPFVDEQPWGIFLVEANTPRVYTTHLRQILRALAPTARTQRPNQKAWRAENLLFVCVTPQYDSFTFAHFKGEKARQARLATFGWERNELAVRTLCEFNLPALNWPQVDLFGEPVRTQWLKDWASAFDVEKVTKTFFREYRKLFEQAESKIKGIDGDEKRLFTQKLFNRLLFIRFLEKKGWLTFEGKHDYLNALWNDYRAKGDAQNNFYRDRLQHLFFAGLNTPQDVNVIGINQGGFLRSLIGDVPYLNGGLFDRDVDDSNAKISVPDTAIAPLLADLFYRFNFTVTETTPLDIQVAVDPEMLGKIFEELVTGRHESGSYYTPKPIVSFMCREALKTYLITQCANESVTAIAQLVDEHETKHLHKPERVIEALRQITICDPACGSGAYLLGMMHELLDLRHTLFASYQLDAQTVYERKLEIIENNLYGVDNDPFAVNIARLRLWLSLIVDYEGNQPLPLPNLDFKIEVGDSLNPPNPQGTEQSGLRDKWVKLFDEKKNLFMQTHHYGEKQTLRREIDHIRSEIASWSGRRAAHEFDWRIDFAEVMTTGGFDIVIANPPYIRMELFKNEKPTLRQNFPQVHTERADYYVYFYARAHELLKANGVGCFISSNKWLRAGYGEKLRQYLLDAQAFLLVVDMSDLPVFESATAYPSIFAWQKQARDNTQTKWAVVRDLQECYDDGVREHVERIATMIPASQFGSGKPRLAVAIVADRRSKMEASGIHLSEFVKGQILFGVKTGLNSAFVIDRQQREELIRKDKHSSEVIKPLVVGDDVRRYEIHFRDSYLLYMVHGIDIGRYPAIKQHLAPFRGELENRATKQKWYELQQPSVAQIPYWENPKIVYPIIGRESRFVIDARSNYTNDKVFMLPVSDWYLLGVLNSKSVFAVVAETFSQLRGGFYEFRAIYMETLPIPNASQTDRDQVGTLAQEAQRLHTQRRARVERFLNEIGTSPAESSSRNPLEKPWEMSGEEFERRAKNQPLRLFNIVKEETIALTEQISTVETEIDERVATLYGL